MTADHDGAHAHGDPGHDHAHRATWRARLRHLVAPHSHDAADAVDRELEASQDGVRALKISLVLLTITAVFQVAVVAISGSVALLADTVHNFADALTAAPLWVAFVIGRRAPTRRYTYGYGRAEDLAGLAIVVVIGLSAAVAAWEAIDRLAHPRPVDNLAAVMVAGIVGFAGNELVAVYRIRVGRRIGSAALVADGVHARTDGLTSLAVVAGAIGVAFGYDRADPIAGLAITVAILVVLRDAVRQIYRRLMDAVDPALVQQVEDVLRAVPGVEGIDGVRIRWVGHELRAEAEVTSAPHLSLVDAHAIAARAHHQLLHEVPRLTWAIIHTSPSGHTGDDHHASMAHHFRPSSDR